MTNRHTPNDLKQNLCDVDRPGAPITRQQAMAAIGQVVYAVRLDDGVIKIGCTSNLANRILTLRHSNASGVELLAVAIGGRAEEAAIHAALAQHRARGLEYYHPTSAVLDQVNTMRAAMDLPAIAA